MKNFDIILDVLQRHQQDIEGCRDDDIVFRADIEEIEWENGYRNVFIEIKKLDPVFLKHPRLIKPILNIPHGFKRLASFKSGCGGNQFRHQILIGKCLSQEDEDAWALLLTLDSFEDDSGDSYHVSGYASLMEDATAITNSQNEILEAPQEEAVDTILKAISSLTGGDAGKIIALKKAIQNRGSTFIDVWDSMAIASELEDKTPSIGNKDKKKPGRL